MMVKFDDKTQGVDFAEKGEAAIITWEQRGEDKFATMVTPKLAKLPDGVTEIKVEEIHQLISNGTPMTLVDARPESRYDQAHLPGAISIPVPKLKKMQAAVLSDDKDKLLLFYCGGPT
jgi:3-mercaptopyruvate sulfurtransferase SseA